MKLLLLRTAEEELASLLREDFQFYSFLCRARGVAVAFPTLTSEDRALSNHRSHGYYLAKGGSLRRMICEILGKAEGSSGKWINAYDRSL